MGRESGLTDTMNTPRWFAIEPVPGHASALLLVVGSACFHARGPAPAGAQTRFGRWAGLPLARRG